MNERDFYWINPQSVVIPKGKLQNKRQTLSKVSILPVGLLKEEKKR